jgi:hypothetical protein
MVCGFRRGPLSHKGPNTSHPATTEHVEVGHEDNVLGCSSARGTLHSGPNQEGEVVGTRPGRFGQMDSNYGALPIGRTASVIPGHPRRTEAAHAP